MRMDRDKIWYSAVGTWQNKERLPRYRSALALARGVVKELRKTWLCNFFDLLVIASKLFCTRLNPNISTRM